MRDDQLATAAAVARSDRARLLNADNTAGRVVTLTEAVTSGRAYFVTPRPELLVVDLDLPDDPRDSADVCAAFDLLIDAATRAHVPHVIVHSGRPGHQHAYLVTGTGGARRRLEDWCRTHGLDVRTRGVRPPGAPHRTAAVPTRPLGDVERVVSVLTATPEPHATSALAHALNPLTLPKRVLLAARRGHSAAGYASPSHARMALAVAIRGRGGSPALLASVLNDTTSPLGATFRARPARWRHSELARLWDKAGEWIIHSSTDHRHHLDRIAAAAAAAPWRGTGQSSQLAVLETLLRTAREHRTRVVSTALADIAIGAGLSKDSARTAVRRLVAAGWLQVVTAEGAYTARSYRLRTPAGVTAAAPTAPAGGRGDGSRFSDLGADLARWRALGKVTVRVARAFAGGASDITDVAQQLTMSTRAVRHHVRKLVNAGLARLTGTRVVTDDDTARIHEAEHALGTAGTRERQQALVAAERALRAAVRAAFHERHLLTAAA